MAVSKKVVAPGKPTTDSASSSSTRKVLVIDVGGTHVKLLATGQKESRKIESGPTMTPVMMVNQVKQLVKDWPYDVVAIGYPGPVVHGRPLHNPANLGVGWVGFNFQKAFGKPIRLINDAAMQALGSYQGGSMLFLGLGTGLGSALIVHGKLEPLELAHLPFKKGRTYEDYVGLRGLQRMGKKKWRKYVTEIVEAFKQALEADYVILGGGNSKFMRTLPKDTRLGANENAFLGGFRLWEQDRKSPR